MKPDRATRFLLVVLLACGQACPADVFNVRDYGATGRKSDNARPAIQRALDACAAAGGGTVRLPPGEYTSGTLHLRSRVRLEVQAGATLYASPDPQDYDYGTMPSKAALLYGDGLEGVTITGRGSLDGQAEYEWREDDHERAFENKTLMQRLGKPLMRSFPKAFPQRQVFPHLLWLGNSKAIRVENLRLVRSPSWTLALYACERAIFEKLTIRTSLREGVWADGIDLDGCRDVSISRCDIETGDDCVVFISTDVWGPALPCQNITVKDCRLSSASAGVKFSEGNRAGIRNVRVSDSLLTNVNRGFVFSTTLGGSISNVVLSRLSIHCNRFDWFWAGDGQPFHFRVTRLSEFNRDMARPDEAPPGSIRNVVIRDVTAHAKGSSLIHGHPENWLDGIRLNNVRLRISADPWSPYDKASHALSFRHARNLIVRGVDVGWDGPRLPAWKSALCFDEVRSLDLDRFAGRAAWPQSQEPVITFTNVADARLHRARALDGTAVFLDVRGPDSQNIRLERNDLRQAKVPVRLGTEVSPSVLRH